MLQPDAQVLAQKEPVLPAWLPQGLLLAWLLLAWLLLAWLLLA